MVLDSNSWRVACSSVLKLANSASPSHWVIAPEVRERFCRPHSMPLSIRVAQLTLGVSHALGAAVHSSQRARCAVALKHKLARLRREAIFHHQLERHPSRM